jgi:hypothetical protein
MKEFVALRANILIMNRIYIVLLSVFFFSCGNPAHRKMAKNFAEVFNDKEAMLRKNNLGDEYYMVMKNETPERIIYQDETMIKTSYKYSEHEEYQFTFLFSNNQLSDVYCDVYLPKIEDGQFFTDWMKKKLHAKYNYLGEEKGTMRWEKGGVSVELTNESDLFEYGKVRILYFSTPASEQLPM